MMGTPLHELNMKDDNIRGLQGMHDARYNAMQDLQFEQAHDAQHSLHQAQQNPYYDMPNTENYPQFNKKPMDQQMMGQRPIYHTSTLQNSSNNMEDLAKEISDSLPVDTFSSVGDGQSDQSGDSGLFDSVPKFLIDPIIIFVLFVILSLPVVRTNIGNYITAVNPPDCEVGMTGIIIYGLILAALFAATKKLLS